MYLFFDTETTGLPNVWNAPLSRLSNWPQLVQLAWILYDNDGNEIIKRHHIIHPFENNEPYWIHDDAIKIHRITNEKAFSNGRLIDYVLDEFSKQIQKAEILVAHNVDFDWHVMAAEYLRREFRRKNPFPLGYDSKVGYTKEMHQWSKKQNEKYRNPKAQEKLIPFADKDFICTMEALTEYVGIPGYAENFYKWPKLSELHKKLFGKDFPNAHDATADVRATAKCFWEAKRLNVIHPDWTFPGRCYLDYGITGALTNHLT